MKILGFELGLIEFHKHFGQMHVYGGGTGQDYQLANNLDLLVHFPFKNAMFSFFVINLEVNFMTAAFDNVYE